MTTSFASGVYFMLLVPERGMSWLLRGMGSRVSSLASRWKEICQFPMRYQYLMRFNYDFHPVGQGLFCSGSLSLGRDEYPEFRWVYDCGTSSSVQLVTNAISRLETQVTNRKHLDLVTISHFDKDHISGMAELLTKFSVDVLLLPYMPLWRRLLIAFEQNVQANDDSFRFFINPAEYISSIDGAEIETIVFIVPEGKWRSWRPDREPRPLDQEDDQWRDADRLIEFDRVALRDEAEGPGLSLSGGRTGIRFMSSGSPLTTRFSWEFVPHNEKSRAPWRSKAFISQVEKLRSDLTRKKALLQKTASITALQQLFTKMFGKSSEQKNQISVFLYGGPLSQDNGELGLSVLSQVYTEPPLPCDIWFFGRHFWNLESSSKCGVFYGGDGFLNCDPRLEQLIDSIGNTRLDKIAVFQVMHHGSKKSWQPGVAEFIDPYFSIFCSDPDHRGLQHPNGEVVRDFLKHRPIQVDKTQGVYFEGSLYKYV